MSASVTGSPCQPTPVKKGLPASMLDQAEPSVVMQPQPRQQSNTLNNGTMMPFPALAAASTSKPSQATGKKPYNETFTAEKEREVIKQLHFVSSSFITRCHLTPLLCDGKEELHTQELAGVLRAVKQVIIYMCQNYLDPQSEHQMKLMQELRRQSTELVRMWKQDVVLQAHKMGEKQRILLRPLTDRFVKQFEVFMFWLNSQIGWFQERRRLDSGTSTSSSGAAKTTTTIAQLEIETKYDKPKSKSHSDIAIMESARSGVTVQLPSSNSNEDWNIQQMFAGLQDLKKKYEEEMQTRQDLNLQQRRQLSIILGKPVVMKKPRPTISTTTRPVIEERELHRATMPPHVSDSNIKNDGGSAPLLSLPPPPSTPPPQVSVSKSVGDLPSHSSKTLTTMSAPHQQFKPAMSAGDLTGNSYLSSSPDHDGPHHFQKVSKLKDLKYALKSMFYSDPGDLFVSGSMQGQVYGHGHTDEPPLHRNARAPWKCAVCGEKVSVGAGAAKCQECKMVVHETCRQMYRTADYPCVPKKSSDHIARI